MTQLDALYTSSAKAYKVFLWFFLLTPFVLSFAHGQQSKPNIIVFFTDDQGYGDLSCYEHAQPDVKTPAIDRIAETGVKLTDGYVSSPICSPSRAGLMTGRYPERFGSYTHHDSRLGLPVHETTIAEILGEAGYRTGMVGKWHLGFADKFHPVNRGFDWFYGFLDGGGDHYAKPDPDDKPKLQKGMERVTDEGPLTELLTDEAIHFIKDNEDTPFFLYFAYWAPHTPLSPPPEKYEKMFSDVEDEDRRIYLSMLAQVDNSVGRILDVLQSQGISDNTLIFFLSDNGAGKGNAASSKPLRNKKGSVWEGGIRVPFLVRWPDVLPEGKTVSEPVMSLDILPTSIAAANGELDEPVPYEKKELDPEGKLSTTRAIDGRNMIPALNGELDGPLHDTLFWTHSRKKWGEQWAVREGKWKLVREGPDLHLSNLKQDVGEKMNLANEHPQVVERLETKYRTWRNLMAPHRVDR